MGGVMPGSLGAPGGEQAGVYNSEMAFQAAGRGKNLGGAVSMARGGHASHTSKGQSGKQGARAQGKGVKNKASVKQLQSSRATRLAAQPPALKPASPRISAGAQLAAVAAHKASRAPRRAPNPPRGPTLCVRC